LEALLTSFIAAVLAEWGDKTQWLVVALAARYRRPLPILLGIGAAALANGLVAAFGGTLVHDLVVLRALSLLVALALIFAGAAGLLRTRPPDMGSSWKTGPFLTAFGCFWLLELGDKTQFTTFALAAQFDSLVLAGLGAAAGVTVSNVPAALLAERLPAAVPVRAIRIAAAILFLLVGLYVAVSSLRLI
jgi:putative Ca2+/H+ antiporter (TMEM165/GDT1 family)